MIIATIDPGINTGIALWEDHVKLPVCKFIAVKSGIGEINQLESLCKGFYTIVLGCSARECVIESDEFWKGSLKSETSATRGNLSLLSHIVGAYFGVCSILHVKCSFIKAREWKGQMSKEIVARRVEMALGIRYSSSHITDAVGIGLALKGLL